MFKASIFLIASRPMEEGGEATVEGGDGERVDICKVSLDEP